MIVRDETPADEAAIRAVVEAAFRPMPFSQQTEHRIVDELRRQGALSISLVACWAVDAAGQLTQRQNAAA